MARQFQATPAKEIQTNTTSGNSKRKNFRQGFSSHFNQGKFKQKNFRKYKARRFRAREFQAKPARQFQERTHLKISGNGTQIKDISGNIRQSKFWLGNSRQFQPRQFEPIQPKAIPSEKLSGKAFQAILIKTNLNKETFENTKQGDSGQGNFR